MLKQSFCTTIKQLDWKVAKTQTFWRQIHQNYLVTLKLKAAAAIDCVGLLHDFSIAILSVQNVNHSGNYSSSMNFDEKYLWSVCYEMSWNSVQLQKLLQSRVSRDFVEIIVYFVCVSVLCFAKIWTLTKEKTLLNRTCAISRKKSQKWPTLMQFTKTKPEWRKGQPFWMIFTQHLFQTPLLSEVLEILQCKLNFTSKWLKKRGDRQNLF